MTYTVCTCPGGYSCSSFSRTTFTGPLGELAESYKKTLWDATSGHALGEIELAALKLDVAAVLGMDQLRPISIASAVPKFGNCARTFTIKLLKYRMCQGSPHTAAALILIPCLAGSHPDRPLPPALLDMVRRVSFGQVPNYADSRSKPDLFTVFSTGIKPHSFNADIFSLSVMEQMVWTAWAKTRAVEMLGDVDAWRDWMYEGIAPAPSPVKLYPEVFLSTAPDSPEPDPPFIPRDYDYPMFAPLHVESNKVTLSASNTSSSGRTSSSDWTMESMNGSASDGGSTGSTTSTRIIISPPDESYQEMMHWMVSNHITVPSPYHPPPTPPPEPGYYVRSVIMGTLGSAPMCYAGRCPPGYPCGCRAMPIV